MDEARVTVADAEAEHAAAIERVDRAEAEVATAREAVRDYAVEAYVNPPAEDSLRVLSISQADDAGYVNSVLEIMTAERDKVVDEFVAAKDRAAAEQTQADAAADAARQRANDAELELIELDRARADQQELAEQLDERLDAALAEAAAIEELDRQLAEQLRAEELALRRTAPPTAVQVASSSEEAALAPSPSTTAGPETSAGSAAPAPPLRHRHRHRRLPHVPLRRRDRPHRRHRRPRRVAPRGPTCAASAGSGSTDRSPATSKHC